jgi:hypothetical protein
LNGGGNINLAAVRRSIRAFNLWVLCVLVPSAVVFAASRLNVLRTKPWWLMLVGPIVYVVGLLVVMTMYNILFASARRH